MQVQISDTDVKRLLHQIYGFQPHKHHKDMNNAELSWSWSDEKETLVEAVVRWPSGAFASHVEDVADSLGLEVGELAEAISGDYPGSCLRFIFFVHHAHRHLEKLTSWYRKRLVKDSERFLRAIGDDPRKQCERLMRRSLPKIAAIRGHDDLRGLSDRLMSMVGSLGN